MTDQQPSDAIRSLTDGQRQLDADGVEVGVSRQALDEVLAYLAMRQHDPLLRQLCEAATRFADAVEAVRIDGVPVRGLSAMLDAKTDLREALAAAQAAGVSRAQSTEESDRER